MSKRPVLIELDDTDPKPSVSDAPDVPEPVDVALPEPQTIEAAAKFATRRASRIVRLFWSLALAVVVAVVTSAAWTFVTGWIAQNPIVGWSFALLFGVFLCVVLVLVIRELAALSRLRGLDALRRSAETALQSDHLKDAQAVTARLDALYKNRGDMRWHRDRFGDLKQDQLDASGLLALAERELLEPLDQRAVREVEAAARQVATVTALVPLALADVATALWTNVRMIRRIAEIYGGRGGTLGAWRLTRTVMAHLVATGAIAVGDDMLEPLVGGSLLGKLSRRFGEGLVNGALTARVGVAAIEVCRPLPFTQVKAPRARDLVRSALAGLVPGRTPSK